MTYRWAKTGETLQYGSVDTCLFADSLDHWNHGVCRLLGIDDEDGRRWVEAVVEAAAETSMLPGPSVPACLPDDVLVECLRHGWEAVRPAPQPPVGVAELQAAPPVLGCRPDTVFAAGVAGDPNLAVIGCGRRSFGWLIDTRTMASPAHETAYDASYFEGNLPGVGYGAYLEQETWRMEKARRFLRRVEGATRFIGLELRDPPALLDVGAGYGFFRQAADESGWHHEGAELSEHAVQVSKELFGFSTFLGDLDAFAAQSSDRFDVVTMWDVLEHVADPQGMLDTAWTLLRPGGALFVRTPNIDALERRVFGGRYHSFKPEHLVYFGPRALVEAAHAAGFTMELLATDAHLLRGFVGPKVDRFARLLQGSDVFAVAVKRPESG